MNWKILGKNHPPPKKKRNVAKSEKISREGSAPKMPTIQNVDYYKMRRVGILKKIIKEAGAELGQAQV